MPLETPTEEESKTRIGSRTAVSIGVVITLVSAAVWLNNRFSSIDTQIASLKSDVAAKNVELQTGLNSVGVNRWTAQDMEIFVLKMRLSNPTVNIPDIGEIISRRQQAAKQ